MRAHVCRCRCKVIPLSCSEHDQSTRSTDAARPLPLRFLHSSSQNTVEEPHLAVEFLDVASRNVRLDSPWGIPPVQENLGQGKLQRLHVVRNEARNCTHGPRTVRFTPSTRIRRWHVVLLVQSSTSPSSLGDLGQSRTPPRARPYVPCFGSVRDRCRTQSVSDPTEG